MSDRAEPGNGGASAVQRALPRMEDGALASMVAQRDERAFEELYARHHRGALSLCRHLLGSTEEAEDVLQHTFGVAFRELSAGERPTHPGPWIYAIARNRCLTVLRRRRELPSDSLAGVAAGLPDEVQQRAELRELVRDIGRLPEEQRAALVLSELDDLEHAQVAKVLGCPPSKVRALVYQARSTLSGWREARERPCIEVREHIAVGHGAELRRGPLRKHMQVCEDCAAFQENVVQQRRKVALVLPVVLAPGVSESILEGAMAAAGAAGGGAGAAGGGAGAAGGGGAGASGMLGATALKIGAASLVLGGAGLGVFGGLNGESQDEEPVPAPERTTAQRSADQVAARDARAKAGDRKRSERASRRRASLARENRLRDSQTPALEPAGEPASASSRPVAPEPAPAPDQAAAPAPAPAPGQAPGSGQAPVPDTGLKPAPAPAPAPTPAPGPAPAPAPGSGQDSLLPGVEVEVEVEVNPPPLPLPLP